MTGSGPLDGLPDHRDGRDRPGTDRGDAARRHGRRGDPCRTGGGGPRPGARRAARRHHAARPPQPGPRPQAARRRDRAARPRRTGRRPRRGLPPRCHGAPRGRPAGVPRPQPAARLRADDRVGSGRSVVDRRRSRHQLHLAGGGARPLRSRGPAADPAAQPRRRLRRRSDVPRLRRRVRAAWRRSAAGRARSSTRRWSTARRC